jgi:hypothetical protein
MRRIDLALSATAILAGGPAAAAPLLECVGGKPRSAILTGMYRVEVARAADGRITADLLGGAGGGVLARWTVVRSRQGATEAYSAKGFWLETTKRKGIYRSRSRWTPEPYRNFRGIRARLVRAQVPPSKGLRTRAWRIRGLRMVCRKMPAPR